VQFKNIFFIYLIFLSSIFSYSSDLFQRGKNNIHEIEKGYSIQFLHPNKFIQKKHEIWKEESKKHRCCRSEEKILCLQCCTILASQGVILSHNCIVNKGLNPEVVFMENLSAVLLALCYQCPIDNYCMQVAERNEYLEEDQKALVEIRIME